MLVENVAIRLEDLIVTSIPFSIFGVMMGIWLTFDRPTFLRELTVNAL